MQAYYPEVAALASLESTWGTIVMAHERPILARHAY